MSNCNSVASSSGFTADELEVAGILLNLPSLINNSKSSHNLMPSVWGVKKKRSYSDCPNPNSPMPTTKLPPVTVKLEPSTSPATPMAFPSNSINYESKPIRPKHQVPLGLKGELVKECERLTDVQHQLGRELEKAKVYCDQLMVENKILQERRQKVKKGSLTLPITQSEAFIRLTHCQQHPSIIYPCQQVGPRGIALYGPSELYLASLGRRTASDLEHAYRIRMAAMAQSKAAAAFARRNRRLILKTKNSNRLPRCTRL